MRPLLGKRFLYSNFIDMINSIFISIGKRKQSLFYQKSRLQTASASGRAFPIWNTKSGDNKLMSLSIHGRTEQSDTPTPANPVPMRSVGDTGLLLSVMPDKAGSDYQLLNIKEAMKKAGHDGILRSVNGIYDEVVYNGKEWKLIQRIGVSTGFTVTSISTLNSNGDLREVLIRGSVKGTQVTPDVSTFYNNKFYYTGDSTSNKWNNVYGVYTNSLRYGFTVIYDITDYPTEETLKAIIEDESTIYYYVLFTPAEYPLDLPVITTYDEQTYFASNAAEVKPRMIARCKVSKALDYIREGLIGYYTGRGRSNTDENKNILPDLSGNGNDLENKNFAYTVDSGYGDGYIQYDGIDDFSGLKTSIPATKRTVLFTVSDIHRLNENSNAWCGLIDGQNYFLGINNGTGFTQSGRYIMNGVVSNVNFNILDKGDNIYVAGAADDIGTKQIDNITIGSTLNRSTYACKCKIYDVLLYERILTEEEILHNYKVSCQYNGEDFSFDPIEQNLIASYRTYDKTNEAEDRDILKDLSGNGHDIQLHNFAFSEGSGYGLYANDFSKFNVHPDNIGQIVYKYNKIEVIGKLKNSFLTFSYSMNLELNSTKIRVLNLPENLIIYYRYVDSSYTQKTIIIRSNGIHDLPSSLLTEDIIQVGFQVEYDSSIDYTGLTIEQIPDYQGALVSDGVDDYGLCENFPILTKEKGYTVCAIRKNLNTDLFGTFLSKRISGSVSDGAFYVERKVTYQGGYFSAGSFGNSTEITSVYNSDLSFISQTLTKYLSHNIIAGEVEDTNWLYLFTGYKGELELSSIALYAIEIYNRDLTDEEIAKVKERMIAEYELKTGNKYEEE